MSMFCHKLYLGPAVMRSSSSTEASVTEILS